MEKDGENCLDRPENNRRSGRDTGRETINSENNCKGEKNYPVLFPPCNCYVMRGEGLLREAMEGRMEEKRP